MTLPTDDRVDGEPALLLQGHRRGQAVDLVDLGHAQLVEQPPGVGGDRFEIPPLRLRVERAEGQRRLARAGHAREDDQGVARDAEVDVLEVVLPRPADVDEPLEFPALRAPRDGIISPVHSRGSPWRDDGRSCRRPDEHCSNTTQLASGGKRDAVERGPIGATPPAPGSPGSGGISLLIDPARPR